MFSDGFTKTQRFCASAQVNLSTTSAGGTMTSPRPHGPATSAATTALNQSVLLGGNSAGQGQMYLRVSVGGKQVHSFVLLLLNFVFFSLFLLQINSSFVIFDVAVQSSSY